MEHAKTLLMAGAGMGAIEGLTHLPIDQIINILIQIGVGIATIYKIIRGDRRNKKALKDAE